MPKAMIYAKNKKYIGLLTLFEVTLLLLIPYWFVRYGSRLFPEKETTSSSAIVINCRPLKNIEDGFMIEICDAHGDVHYCKSQKPYSKHQQVVIEYIDDKTDYKYTIIKRE